MRKELNDVVIVSACRTPIGDYGGSMQSLRANDISKIVATEVINRVGIDPREIDEIVLGMCMHHGNGSLPARIISQEIGMSVESSASMVSQNCASGISCSKINIG